MSLSTIAILNSVKKAVESNSRHRSRSTGAFPFPLSSQSLDKMCNRGKPQVAPGAERSAGFCTSDTVRLQMKLQNRPPSHPFLSDFCFLIFKTNNFGHLGFWVRRNLEKRVKWKTHPLVFIYPIFLLLTHMRLALFIVLILVRTFGL